MFGGDVDYQIYESYEEALEHVRKKINIDSTKCGHIKSWGAKLLFYVWIKDVYKTNPTASPRHDES